ncbi:MAG: tetratricopeptide repeat protein, partial [Aliifodinibius sp.]|nr:tetratricopeptide repeat protein [Fodinibius sp.]NIW97573.1 tetratricopeptide repeat protein [Phycisphaerae bacterium]
MNTPDINTLFSQANRFLQAGQIPQAIKICKKILAVSPGHPDGYNLMGILFSERKDYRQALHYFRLALKAVPEEPLFLLNTAKAHKNLRQFNDAIDSFRKIITINPNLHFSYAGLGSVYLEQGNYEDAIKYFQTAIRLAPDNSDHHYNLSLAFQKNNNHDM